MGKIAADKRLKNAKWLSDLVINKIENTIKNLENAQMRMDQQALGATRFIDMYIQEQVDAAAEVIKRELNLRQQAKAAKQKFKANGKNVAQ